MNSFKKFAVTFIFMEVILVVICNLFVYNTFKENVVRSYKVDIERALGEMLDGTSIENINLDNYKSIIDIKVFSPKEICNNEYTVEEVNGILYRFEYRQESNNNFIISLNIVAGIFLISTVILLMLIEGKIIRPFNAMNELATELAKGNLSVPIKEEKSKFFGRFLWGMDMLRNKLEHDRIRELELLKDKKTLILSLSHDIKTPLSAIELYTKAILENLYSSDEKRREAVYGIEKNTEEIKRYVNEIAYASREDFMNLQVINKEFYLSEVIHFITIYYKEKMLQTHTEFIVDDVNNCLIYGDKDRAIEVLQNIIENGLKYGDGKKIHISFREEEDCKLITIENSGCSLKEEEINHIFDSFYRGSNSEKIKGSGLGLYICKNLLHKMNGDIFAKISEDSFMATIVLKKM